MKHARWIIISLIVGHLLIVLLVLFPGIGLSDWSIIEQGKKLLFTPDDKLIQVPIWVSLLGLGILYGLLSIQQRDKTSTVHGSARLATRQEAQQYRASWHPSVRRYCTQQHAPESRLVLGTYHGHWISLSERQQESNVLLTAPVGSGKSSRVIIPNLLREQGHRSLFIADLKGELYPVTAGALSHHHQVLRFAPTQPQASCGYNPLELIQTIEDAQDFADCWIRNTGEHHDPYWSNTARMLITATCMHLRTAERQAPFSRLSDLLTHTSFETLKQTLMTSPSQQAQQTINSFLDAMSRNERLVGSIMTDIGNRFQVLASPHIRQVTTKNQVNFISMVEHPTVLYQSIPRHATRRLQPLIACMMLQMFTTWERVAEQHPEQTLPRGIACYLDEFTNAGTIPGFAEIISSARSKRIALILAIQSFSQLDARYGKEDAETIRSNAVTHLLLPGAGLPETLYYSERIGDTTVAMTTHTTNQNQQTRMQGETRRRLITPEELRTMDENTMLMLSKSSSPMMIKTTPYFAHRRMHHLTKRPPANETMPPLPEEDKKDQDSSFQKHGGNNDTYFLPE